MGDIAASIGELMASGHVLPLLAVIGHGVPMDGSPVEVGDLGGDVGDDSGSGDDPGTRDGENEDTGALESSMVREEGEK